jgi:predicted phosphodiesterase
MRLALLADVHANLEALTVVLREAEARGCEAILCAGDLVGYGPDPDACVRLLVERGALCVLGNHDLMVLERMALDRCVPDGRRAVRWTRRVLDPEVRRRLEAMPLLREVPPGIVVCHGSLDDPDEYVSSSASAHRQLLLLKERYPEALLLVGGHTHRAALYASDPPGSCVRIPSGAITLPVAGQAPWFVNPGSVGQSRDERALARFAVYDVEQQAVEFLALAYEVATCQRKIFAAGLSTPLFRPRASPAARAVRLARRVLGRVRRFRR